MLQRLGIRGKILAVVAVPILVLILAAGFITYGATQDLSSAQNSEQLVETLDTARGLEADLQDERNASVNFVHLIQDTRGKLVVGRNDTDDSLADAVARIQEVGGDDADAVIASLYAAVGVTSAEDPLFPEERALTITPPAEDGDWVTFPADDAVADMQESYAAAQARVDAVAEMGPEDAGGAFQTLSFRIGFESDMATQLFTEPQAYQAELETITADVDSGIAAMLGSTELLADNEANADAVAALGAGEQAVANLGSVRAGIRSSTGNVLTYLGFYRGLLVTIVDAADDVAVAMTDREVVGAMQAYGDLDALIENIKYEQVQFERLIRTGSFAVGEDSQARTLVVTTDISLADAQSTSASVTGAEPVPDFGASVSFSSSLDQQSFDSVRSAIVRGNDADLAGQRDAAWTQQVEEELAVYEPLREDMWTDVEEMVAEDSQSALLQAILTALVAVLVIVASVVVALLIARRIVNPLRRLTTTATAVRQELPRLVERVAMPGESVDVSEVQINVESRDEIGTLAEAFNGVNAATLAIAGEQAALRGSISEMFVNVARRDQVLLNRQLSSIDEMERTEDDPTTLTKLFALDHLATRMRRNSESLLVLAGIDTGRRLRRPMPLSDVIRTASSEIELYERVQLELDADPSMLGHSALTAAHLFAELLENATVFSDPGTPVVVRTAQVDGNFVVEVEDSGIGMAANELVEANNRVASTAASEILGAQRLGLFVVGRIARRVGARVEIRSDEGKGTVATVTMPPSLFAADEEVPETHVSSSATDEATQAPAALVSHNASDEISDVSERSTASAGAAYTPAVVEEGASLLTGRGGSAEPGAAAAPAPEPDANSIEALIAADAAEAPTAVETNPEELTSGETTAGLPTRRRREAPAHSDAEREQQSIVGLPARATDAQLSALEAEQASGFTPSVSPSEVTPQSAEERSSMFRGFRPRHATEPEAPVDLEGESLGHAARRGGLDASALAAERQATPEPHAVPVLEPDDDASTAAASAPSADHDSADGPGMGAVAAGGAFGAAAFFGSRRDDSALSDSAGNASAPTPPETADVPAEPVDEEDDASSDRPQDDGVPIFRMPKFDGAAGMFAGGAAAGAGAAADSASAPSAGSADHAGDVDAESGPMVIPSLEIDDEPVAEASVASAPESVSAPRVESAPEYSMGVESVSLDEDYPGSSDAPEPADEAAWAASAASAPEPTPWATALSQPSPASAVDAQPEPGSEAPSYDEPVGASQSPAADPAVGFAPSAPAYEQPSTPVEPAASSVPESSGPSMDELIQSATDDDTEQRPGFFSRLFGRGNKKGVAAGAAAASVAASAPSQPSATPVFQPVSASEPPAQPSAPAATSAPLGGFAPEDPAPAPSVTSAPAPWEADHSAPQESAPSAPAAPWETAAEPQLPERASAYEPMATEEPAPETPAPAPTAFAPQESDSPSFDGWAPSPPAEPAAAPTSYSPDQLAQPAGWEAAGASALQAADPEVTTSYQPVIQPDSGDGSGGADMTSEVFSELSSLAAERPKVEKTRAGLQRRRPSNAEPVEVTPIEDEVTIAPSDRDADAVRSRFSSFYSGTQRARDDVANFERQTEPAEATDQ